MRKKILSWIAVFTFSLSAFTFVPSSGIVHVNGEGSSESNTFDINGDGRVNLLDLLRLKKYLASADPKENGILTAKDLTRLQKFLLRTSAREDSSPSSNSYWTEEDNDF